MTNKYLSTLLSITLLLGTASVSQAKQKSNKKTNSTEVVQDTTKKTDSGTTKTSSDTVNGKVTEYQPGKSITVSVPGTLKKTRTFDLNGKDITANVDTGVAVGSRVRVIEKTDNNGHKTVSVEQSGSKHARKHS